MILRGALLATGTRLVHHAFQPSARRTFVQGNGIPDSSQSTLDAQVLREIQSQDPRSITLLSDLYDQYSTKARTVLPATLAYESTPSASRRVSFDSDDGLVLLAHAVDAGHEHKITFCSGFAIETDSHDRTSNKIVSCAHTLEEMRRSRFMNPGVSVQSATLIYTRDQAGLAITEPAREVLTSLPRSDLVIFSRGKSLLRTLPVSPYPARIGTRIRAHFVSETRPADDSGWSPWIHGTWRKWVHGEVLGYRDFAGREAEPGTYDSLNHLLFHPSPLAGSSGGPIVDEETGSVVGMVLGSRMDNMIEGVRGWGVPSEVMYEMFRLPGLGLHS